jgi:hypothetical protein
VSKIIEIGYKCRPVFIPFHKRKQRWAVIVAHRRAGKTYAALHDLLDHALRTNKTDARFAFGAPTFSQVKDVAWNYLKRSVRNLPGVTINESELWVELYNKARIRLYALDTSYERMRGLYLDGIVLDEYADIDPKAWAEVIRPALSDRQGWAVWIGTSKGRDAFYKVYSEAVANPETFYSQVLKASETGIIPADELADATRTMSESQYNREFECSFDEPDINQLISGTVVKAAQERKSVAQGPRLLGVDVARFGDDRTVIAWRDGDVCENFSVFRGIDTMETVGRVAKAADEYKPDALFVDVVGIGAGVVDRLRQLRYQIIEVGSGNKAMDDAKYGNLRAEMWFKMAAWLKDRGQIPARLDLDNDLTGAVYKFDHRNRMFLESKDDMKKRGLPSPDLADALALTFAQPVAPRDMVNTHLRQSRADDYDPLERRRPQMADQWSPF